MRPAGVYSDAEPLPEPELSGVPLRLRLRDVRDPLRLRSCVWLRLRLRLALRLPLFREPDPLRFDVALPLRDPEPKGAKKRL